MVVRPDKPRFEQALAENGARMWHLSVRLGNTLKFVFLFDGVRVGRALSCVDQLVGKALSNRLDVAEGRFTGLCQWEEAGVSICRLRRQGTAWVK